MEEIIKYLAKHKNLTPPDASKVKIVQEVIRSECGIAIKTSEIKVQHKGIFLSCHPTKKCEIVKDAPVLLQLLQKRHNIRLSHIC